MSARIGSAVPCACRACARARELSTLALVFALALACGLTAGAWLERFGL